MSVDMVFSKKQRRGVDNKCVVREKNNPPSQSGTGQRMIDQGDALAELFRYIGTCSRWGIAGNQLVRGKNRLQIYKLLRLLANLSRFFGHYDAHYDESKPLPKGLQLRWRKWLPLSSMRHPRPSWLRNSRGITSSRCLPLDRGAARSSAVCVLVEPKIRFS